MRLRVSAMLGIAATAVVAGYWLGRSAEQQKVLTGEVQLVRMPLEPGFESAMPPVARRETVVLRSLPVSAEFARLETGARELQLPIPGLEPSQLHDTFTDGRSQGRRHDAIDIMADEGTPVRAVAAGRLVKLFRSVRGGITLYQFDAGEQFSYYYAHLQRYAPGLEEGQYLEQGELLGYVGHTGNASAQAPHLHFAITRLPPERNWWQGEAINPYPLLLAGEAPR